jgi:hypothetical protein
MSREQAGGLVHPMTLPSFSPFSEQTWHWNEKRYIAQYYADLSKKEAAEELQRQAAIKAKVRARSPCTFPLSVPTCRDSVAGTDTLSSPKLLPHLSKQA